MSVNYDASPTLRTPLQAPPMQVLRYIFCVSLSLQFRTRLRVQLNKHLQHQAAVFVSAALLFDYACLSATCFNYWLLMYSVAVTASNLILYPVKRLKRKTTEQNQTDTVAMQLKI